MREVKFKIYLQHEETGIVCSKVFSYDCLFSGAAKFALETEFKRRFVIGKAEFTGLKDKDGKEIYEGDIIVCSGNKTMFGEVIFENGQCVYIHRGISNKDYNNGELIPVGYGYKIIGNIYENPELLKNEI